MRSDCNLSTVLWQSSAGHMGVCFQFHPQCQAAGWDRTVFINSGREPAVKQSDRLGSNPLQLSFLLKWLPSLPILMRESFCLCQCRDRYIISLFPHLHTPFPPLPSLISHIVSVDVKHHVYLWMAVAFCLTGWNSTLTGLWWISHQGTLWILAVCCFLQWEASFSDSVLPDGHSRLCFGQSWPCRCRSGSFEVQLFHILLVWTMLFGFTTDLNQIGSLWMHGGFEVCRHTSRRVDQKELALTGPQQAGYSTLGVLKQKLLFKPRVQYPMPWSE